MTEVHEYESHYVPEYEHHERYVQAEPVVHHTTYSAPYDVGHYDFPVVSRHQEHHEYHEVPSWVTHPELNHKYDDAHDVEPVPYHDHRVLHSRDIPDHHSYGHKVTAKVTEHDFKPMHHSDYDETQQEAHELAEAEASTYYDHSTYKQHAKSYTPTYHMDVSQGHESKPILKAPTKPAATKKGGHSRDIEYIVDGYGHVHTIEHLL